MLPPFTTKLFFTDQTKRIVFGSIRRLGFHNSKFPERPAHFDPCATCRINPRDVIHRTKASEHISISMSVNLISSFLFQAHTASRKRGLQLHDMRLGLQRNVHNIRLSYSCDATAAPATPVDKRNCMLSLQDRRKPVITTLCTSSLEIVLMLCARSQEITA